MAKSSNQRRNFGSGVVSGNRAVDIAFAAAACASGKVFGLGASGGWSRSLAAILIAGISGQAIAGPEGASVVRGDVSISRNGAETLIRAGRNSIINYRSFDIAANETVRFMQPDSQSRVLNRIYNAAPTRIDGSLIANGRVYIVNPAGVLFSGTSRVDVNRLYAAAGNISDNDFIRGINRFTDVQGRVTNEGTITSNFVSMVGRSVGNYGEINAPQGTVVMAAGEDVLIGERNGNVFVKVDGNAVADAQNKDAAVTNSGTIDARSGVVSLSSGDVYSLAMRVDGNIKAKRVTAKAKSGEVHVGGKIDASARSGGGASNAGVGGSVEVLGDKIALLQGSSIDVSGTKGGGSVRVGGDIQGKGELATADAVFTAPGSSIKADAINNGQGGSVVVWSDTVSRVYGDISARGGEQGGNGGFIETSSKGVLDLQVKSIDASAPKGRAGQWLLDPINVTISNAANANVSASPNFNPSATGANVDVAAIQTALDGGTSVTVTTTATGVDPGEVGNISVLNSISKTAGGAASLTLTAANNITVSAGITSTTGALNVNLNAGAAVNVDALIDTNGGTFSTTGTTFNNSVNIVALGGATLNHSGIVTLGAQLDVTGGVASITGSGVVLNAALGGASVNFSGGGVSQNASGIVTATTVTLAGTGDSDLSTALNAVGTLQGTKAGNILLQNSVNTTTGTGLTSSSGNIALNTGANTLGITGGLSAASGTIAITSGTLTQSAPITTNQVTLSVSGSATLTDAANSMGRVLGSAANGVSIVNNGALAVGASDGSVGLSTSGSNITINTGTAPLTINGVVNAGAADVSITAGSVSQTAGIIAQDLTIASSGNGAFTLTNASNVFDTVTGTVGGALNIFGSTSYIVTTGGVSTSNAGPLSLTSAGTLTINAAASAGAGNVATITTDSLVFGGGGSVVGSNITYRNRSGGVSIGLGNGAAGSSNIPTADLSKFVTSGTLTVGRNDSGLETGNVSTANLDITSQGYGLSIFSGANIDVGGLILAASRLLSTNSAGTTNFSGAVSATGVNITSASGVTQSAGISTGTLTLEGTGPFTLTNSSNDIDTLTGTGTLGAVSITDSDGFAITGITSTGTVALDSGGAVTQSGAIVAPTLTFAGTGSYTLNDSANDVDTIGGGNASSTIQFRDSDGLDVATITASSLQLQGGAGVTQSGGISATSLTLLGAVNYTLNNASNAISTLTATGVSGLSFTENSGFTVATSSSAGLFALISSGSVSQTGAITAATLQVGGGGSFNLNQNNAVTTLSGASSVNTIDFTNPASFTLGALSAATSISLTSNGTVTQSGSLTSPAFILGGTGTFTLTNGGNDVDTLSGGNASSTISFRDSDGFSLGSLSASSLTLQAGAAVTQSSAITVGSLSLLGAVSYTLNNTGNDFDSVTANNVSSLNLADTDGVALGAISSTGTVTLAAGGAVTQTGALTASSLVLSTGTFTLSNTANDVDTLDATLGVAELTFTDTDGFVVAGISSSGGVTLNSTTGAVTQSASITGDSLTLGGGALFTLDSAGNDVNSISAVGVSGLTFDDSDGYSVAGISTAGNVTLLSGGSVSQTSGISAVQLSLGGTGPFSLNGPGNSVGTLTSSGTAPNVSYSQNNSLVLGAYTGGDLTLNIATGSVTQSAAISVGTLTLDGGAAYTIDNAGNSISNLTGTLTGTGSMDVFASGFNAGPISSDSGSVTLDAGGVTISTTGAITSNNSSVQIAGGTLNINNPVSAGTSISLDASTANVNSTLNAGGAITIVADSLTMTDVATAGTQISLTGQSSNASIGVAGGAGTLQIPTSVLANLNAPSVSIGAGNSGAVTANSFDLNSLSRDYNLRLEGSSISLDGIALNSGNAASTLTLITTGSISQSGSDAIDAVNVVFNAGGGVQLQNQNLIDNIEGTSAGTIDITNSNGTAITVGINNPVTSGNNNITVTAPAGVTIAQPVNAGSGRVLVTTDSIAVNALLTGNLNGGGIVLSPFTPATSIGLGTGTGTFSLSQSEINNLSSTSSVIIGSSNAGQLSIAGLTFGGLGAVDVCLTGQNIFVDGLTGPTGGTLVLENTAGSITQALGGGGRLIAEELIIAGTGTVTLDNDANQVSAFASGAGAVTLVNDAATPLTITTLTANCLTGSVDGASSVSILRAPTLIINSPIGGSTMTLNADTMSILASVSGQDLTISTFSFGRDIQLGGGDNAGELTLEVSELANLNITNSTTFGSNQSGRIRVASDLTLGGSLNILIGSGVVLDGGINVGGGNLALGINEGDGDVIQNAGNIIASVLELDGNANSGSYTLSSVGNNVSEIFGAANGSITYVDADGLTVSGLDATSVNITAGATAVTGAVTANSGDVIFTTSAFNNTAVVSASGEVTIISDDVAIDSTITGANINIRQATNGLNIAVGDEVSGDVSVNDAELARLDTTGTVTFGNDDTGSVSIISVDLLTLTTPRSYSLTFHGSDAAISGGPLALDTGDTLAILVDAGITQSAPIFASNLFVQAGAAVTLTDTTNQIGRFVADTTGGAVEVINDPSFTLAVDSITFRSAGVDTTVRGATSDNQNISITAAAGLTVFERIDAGTAGITLTTDALVLSAPTGGGAALIGNSGPAGPGVTIRVATAGTPIFVGATGSGLEISQTELDLISTTSGLVIRENGGVSAVTLGTLTFAGLTGDVCITGSFTDPIGALTGPTNRSLVLEHTGNSIVTQSGAITAFNLGFAGTGGFNFADAANSVTGTFAGGAALANTLVTSGSLNIGTVTAACGGSPIQPDGPLDLTAPSIVINTAINSGGAIRIRTDSLAINAGVSSTLGTTIENLTAARPIFIGAGAEPADTLSITNAELALLTLANNTLLSIGSSNAGAVTINNALFSASNYSVAIDGASFSIENGIAADSGGSRVAMGPLSLRARSGNITQGESGDGILADSLAIVGDTEGGNVSLFNGQNNVDELSADVKGTFTYIDTNAVIITEPGILTTDDAVTIIAPSLLTILGGAPVNVGSGVLTLISDDLAIAGAITANGGMSIATFTSTRDINIAMGVDVPNSLNISSEELALINSTGLITIGQDVVDAGTLSVGSLDLTSAGIDRNFSLHLFGGDINLQSLTLKTDKALVVKSTDGNITIDGNITAPGTTLVATALDALSGVHGFTAIATGGTVNFGGSINTAGSVSVTTNAFPISIQGEALLIATNTTLSSGAAGANSNVTFAGTIDSASGERNNLTINSPTILLSGAVGGAAAGGTELGTFTSDDGGILTFRGGTFRSAGTITIGENLVLSPLTGDDSLFDATAGDGGSVAFRGTINSDSTATPRALTVNTGGSVGNTLFGGNVGENALLRSLTTNANGTTFLPSIVRTTGDQTYLDDIRISADTTLTAGIGDSPRPGATGGLSELSDVNFGARLNANGSAFALTVDADGVTRFGGDVGGSISGDEAARALSSLTTDAAGTTQVNADVTTTARQTYNDAVIVTSDGVAAVFTGDGLTFNAGINSDEASTVDNGNGRDVIMSGGLNGVIVSNGAGSRARLASLTASGASVTISGSSTSPTEAVVTSGSQSYTVGESIGDRLTITNNIVAGGDFDVRGKATISGNILARNVRFRRVNDESGTTAPITLTGNITSQNSGSVVLFTDALVLGQDTVISPSDSGTALDVTFNTVDSATGSTRALTVTTSGITTFGGAIGATEALSTLTANGGGSTLLSGGSIRTSSGVVLSDNTTLAANTTISTRDVTFGGTVNNASGDRRSLSITLGSTGSATFNSAVGNVLPLGAISVTNNNLDGTITFASPVVLGGDLTLGGNNVTLAGTVNNAGGGDPRRNITISLANGGTSTLSGAIGGTERPGTLTVAASTGNATFVSSSPIALTGNMVLDRLNATLAGAVTTDGRVLINNQAAVANSVRIGGNITSTGIVIGSDAVITNDVTLNANSGTIFLRGNVNSDGTARSLTLRSDAPVNAVPDPNQTDVIAGVTTGTTVTPFRFGGSVGNTSALRVLDINSNTASSASPKAATIVFAPQATSGTGGYNSSGVIIPYSASTAPAVVVNVTESFTMGRNQKLTSFGSLTLNAGTGTVRIADVNVIGTLNVVASSTTVDGASKIGGSSIFRNESNGTALLERGEGIIEVLATQGMSFRNSSGALTAVGVADGSRVVFVTNSGVGVALLGSVGLGRPLNDNNQVANAGFSDFAAPTGSGLLPLDLSSLVITNSATTLAGAIPRNNQEREVTQAIVLSGAFAKPLENMGVDLYQSFTLSELVDYLAGRSIYQDAQRNTEAGVQGRTIVTINRLINQATLEAIEVYCDVFYEDGAAAFAAFANGNNDPEGDRTTEVQTAIRTAWEEYLKDAGAAANGVGFRQQLELGADAATDTERLALKYLNGARDLFEKLDNLGLSPYEIRIARSAIVQKMGGADIGSDILEAAIIGKSEVSMDPEGFGSEWLAMAGIAK